MALEIVRVPVLSDNYIWLVHDQASGETVVVDPATSDEVLAVANLRGWTITQIWNTHWHGDHVGGNEAIKAATGCRIIGPNGEAEPIPGMDVAVGEGDTASIGGITAQVWDVPAHTGGHIAYYLPDAGAIFIGDTLFAMGCGRLFEGTPAQMFTAMKRLAQLPGETAVYCAHEYTLSNGRYALHVEPDNVAVKERMAAVEIARAADEPTVPTTIALERATNPFMRAGTVEELAKRRAEKDNF